MNEQHADVNNVLFELIIDCEKTARRYSSDQEPLWYVNKLHTGRLVSAPPTTNQDTHSRKYQHRRYINIVKVMHLVKVKLYNQ
jgi:hypothetical protein